MDAITPNFNLHSMNNKSTSYSFRKKLYFARSNNPTFFNVNFKLLTSPCHLLKILTKLVHTLKWLKISYMAQVRIRMSQNYDSDHEFSSLKKRP